jgi:arsenite methyltransferase
MQSALTSELRGKVCEAYSAAATSPTEDHPFPIGRAFAENLGYPAALLDTLPPAAVEAFSGVSNVSLIAEIPEGATVLDLGCGAGLDSWLPLVGLGGLAEW